MPGDYLTHHNETARRQTNIDERLSQLADAYTSHAAIRTGSAGRNKFTQTLDSLLDFIRAHLRPIHWSIGWAVGTLFFLYLRLVALTAQLSTVDALKWPEVPAPCVLALWHRDAPSLLAAFVKSKPRHPCAIMIASNPRGDYLAHLCRMLGLEVVRGGGREHGWNALHQLGRYLATGGCVIMTADGGGPAGVAKVGAVALAAAVQVPLVPVFADCNPAMEERHKWDKARNPLPFCKLTVSLGQSQIMESTDAAYLEKARQWLETSLNLAKVEIP